MSAATDTAKAIYQAYVATAMIPEIDTWRIMLLMLPSVRKLGAVAVSTI